MELLMISTQDLMKMFWLAIVSFLIAIAWTPVFTNFLYQNKLGKKIREGADVPIYEYG